MKKKKSSFPGRRLISRDSKERLEAIIVGKNRDGFSDVYARLLASSWGHLALTVGVAYCAINLIFAACYFAIGDGIENARPGSFLDDFFFSVQTMATIGYGKMVPVGVLANTLVTAEALIGFCFLAVMTGLVFAKFSRPTARMMFSEVAVIAPYNGVPHFMLRLANQRGNRVVDAYAHLSLVRKEISREGHKMRRFHDLKLFRERIPLLQLTWTIMHPIDEHSPLYNMTQEKLRQDDTEIIISVTGLDETLSQTIHARYSYLTDEVLFGSVFEDIIDRTEDNKVRVNYRRFHSTRKM